MAWNDIAKLLNNTNIKENKTKITNTNTFEPKCLNNNKNFKQKIETNTMNINQTLNKYNLLRKSLNQKADNNQEIENIPIIHENFENIMNNYNNMNNQRNIPQKTTHNIRHSYEGLPIEKNNNKLMKNEKNGQISLNDNERIKTLNGKNLMKKVNFYYILIKNIEKYSLLTESFEKLQEKNNLLEKEVTLMKENKQYEEMFHQEENKNQQFSMELYLKNEMLLKREEKLK